MYHASSVMILDQCDPSLTYCEHDCFTGINLLLVGWTQQTPSWNCCENNRRNVHWKWGVVITIDVVAGMCISKVTKVQIVHKSRRLLLFFRLPKYVYTIVLSLFGGSLTGVPLLAFVVISYKYKNYKSCEMKHEMNQWKYFVPVTPSFCDHMLSCGALQWNWTWDGSA